MANEDYKKHEDFEELKGLGGMMRRWGVELPPDFLSTSCILPFALVSKSLALDCRRRI